MKRYAFGFLMALVLTGCGGAVGTELESFTAIETQFDDWVVMGKFGPDGPFQVLFVSSRESISEIQNSTVHAFSVFALVERAPGYRFYWGIYVQPVGRITSLYMGLIDPFRRFIIYPSVLRYIRTAWAREYQAGDSGR